MWSTPHIWKFTDTDGDHVADERTVWFDGGSIEGCGNDMHGPYLGPDGFSTGAKVPLLRKLTCLAMGRPSSRAPLISIEPGLTAVNWRWSSPVG